MIINFSIQNFGSIKDKQVLSFEADKSKHLEDTYVIDPDKTGGLRLLKMALIFGANASGKTTILKALDFLKKLVTEPASKKDETLSFQPFLFDAETPKQNSILSIEFLQKGIKYFYEVQFFEKAIVREILNVHNPNKAMVFKRTTDVDNQFTKITFGSKFKIDKTVEKNLEANTLWNNTVFGGFLKTNADLKELKEASDWFKYYLSGFVVPKTSLKDFVTERIEKGELSRQDIIHILKEADFHVSDIIITKQVNRQMLELEHTVKNTSYLLPIALESEGTRRYYGFAGLLALLIKQPTAIAIDELESSLHPDLYLHFILSFLSNAKQSQLIATTHNREILDNKDIFRNDAIWFTDKDENAVTELYSLADFDTSVIRDTTNILNAYKSGKLKGAPILGDYFIDLNA